MRGKNSHPKTVIFLGAGATANLMPMTTGIAEFFSKLFLSSEDNNPTLFLHCVEGALEGNESSDVAAFFSLALILGAIGDSESKKEIDKKADDYSRQFSGDKDKIKASLNELKQNYDWQCLKAVAQHSERENGNISIMSLYSILDILIEKNAGFKTNEYFPPYKVIAARRLALLLTNLLLFIKTKENLPKDQKLYRKFFKTLANIMGKEAISIANNKQSKFTDRGFILFSYAIISFNWDPVLLGMMFEAQKNYNHQAAVPHLGGNVLKLRLFNDFGIVIGSLRKERNKKEFLWYQGHESIANRVNDEDYPSRLMRVGKYLFPHGSNAFRICPVCQKTNFVVRGLSDEKTNYLNFYGPQILPEFSSFYEELLTEREIAAFKNGEFDVVECYECGHLMQTSDTPLIMQSAVKGTKPPLLQEAVNEMASLTKKAKHLVFLGYSLPPDDTIYKSLFLSSIAEKEKKDISIVSYSNNPSGISRDWYYNDEIVKLDKSHLSVYDNFKKVFEKKVKNIRISFKGFPQIINPDNTSYNSVEEAVHNLLYWKE